MIRIQNLEHDMTHGLFSKNKCIKNPDYVGIGNNEIISQRDRMVVKCYPPTVVNDYVPFYFSVRTPMLLNLATGTGVTQVPQDQIIYLACRLVDLATDNFKWCYTNGNAAKSITKFYSELTDIETNVDWKSITSTDFRHSTDGDEDRIRKKHAEFLVKKHVPIEYVHTIVVYNEIAHNKVVKILEGFNLGPQVLINPKKEYYFNAVY